MSSQFDFNNRQIIPLFNTYKCASIKGEIQPQLISSSPKLISIEAHAQSENKWIESRDLFSAIDLIDSALIINDVSNQEVLSACKYVLANKGKTNPLIVEMANQILPIKGETESCIVNNHDVRCEEIYAKISNLKRLTIDYPTNAITWIDRAYYYCLLGMNEQGKKCFRIAINLGKENRFVLRSAARFFLHIDDPEYSLHLLRTAAVTKYDPWLMASEISISEAFEKKTAMYKKGKNAVENQDFSDKDFSMH